MCECLHRSDNSGRKYATKFRKNDEQIEVNSNGFEFDNVIWFIESDGPVIGLNEKL